MTKQIFWTKRIIETFIEEGNLNKRQEYIIRSRAEGVSIIEQAEKLNLSIDQINKEIAKLKKMYDYVQKNCKLLPERKKDRTELYK